MRLSSNLLCGIARVYQQQVSTSSGRVGARRATGEGRADHLPLCLQYDIYQSDVTQVHQSLKKAFNDVFKKCAASLSSSRPSCSR